MKNTIKCPKCKGAGEIDNPVFIGKEFRVKRESRNITLRELSKLINLSPTYICDLEHGRRAWNKAIKDLFEKGLK